MKLGLVDVDWSYVGAKLAVQGDDDQAKFFKALVAEMKAFGTKYQAEYQLAAVNARLDEEEREILGMLGYEKEGGE